MGNSDGYAVICDARAGHSLRIEILALVDRGKSKRLWWTSDDPWIAIRYQSLSAARFAARRLRRNNVRVVSFEGMSVAIREQANDIAHADAMSDCEMGWDDHKGAY